MYESSDTKIVGIHVRAAVAYLRRVHISSFAKVLPLSVPISGCGGASRAAMSEVLARQ